MPNTYVALRTETVATATTSVTLSLSGISGYTDLVLVASGRTSADLDINGRVNSDSGNNYSRTALSGTGSAAVSARSSNLPYFRYNYDGYWTSGAVSTSIAHFMNYSNTTTNKTILTRSNNASTGVDTQVSLWRNTAAITSIEIYVTGGTFQVGSTFNLYGIANADQGAAKATGGIITEDSQYWYHTFGASGAFIPKQSLTCDVLVVAGGGGAGSGQGGGGGAGGLRAFTSQSLSAISYNCTVGGGASGINNGTAPISPGATGGNGTDSTFQTLASATGGGGGSGYVSGSSGSSGGSGGGGGGRDTGSPQAGGAPTIGQGFSGGTGFVGAPSYGGGGGGGAGAAGSNGNSSAGGAGGIGSSAYSSWLQAAGVGELSNGIYYIAGGGAGGLDAFGGLGGGGDSGQPAGTPITVINGSANTGGGGGSFYTNRGAGGSGVIIIRYAK